MDLELVEGQVELGGALLAVLLANSLSFRSNFAISASAGSSERLRLIASCCVLSVMTEFPACGGPVPDKAGDPERLPQDCGFMTAEAVFDARRL